METEQQIQHLYQVSRRAEKRYRALLDFLPYPVVVLNMDHTVSYLNPAFVSVFGWTCKELEGREIPFVPDVLQEQTTEVMQQLFGTHQIHEIATQRLTRDGRMLDILLDGSIFYEEEQTTPAGQIFTLRDVTREKRVARTQQALFRISEQLHQVQGLDELLEFITKEVQALINVGGAMVILLDEERQEFFFRVATLDNLESGKKMEEVRFPVEKGVAGYVYRTGRPLIVPDTSRSPYFFKKVDLDAEYHTRNMLDVPLETRDRRIGVLCVVNKKDGVFEQEDVDFLSTIASTIALPIENARMHEELKRSYQEVQSLNRAKDQVIHHLSHELKTPVSVVAASLSLLEKRLSATEAQGYQRVLERAQRNLQRILDMQYEIEDILRDKEYTTYHLLSILLDACVDELEVLVADEFGEWNVMRRIRRRIEQLFGPQESISQRIPLAQFVQKQVDALRPNFAHRTCEVIFSGEATPAILIPPDVLAKIIEGLLRNAVENTPDGGKIEASVRNGAEGPEFEVKDFGVGITPENQRLIFENYFPAYDTMQYSSRNPYDFNAGGKGFDLLRLKIFSERYHFKLQMVSQRCQYLLRPETLCPGKVEQCAFCHTPDECVHSGGTTMIVQFQVQEPSE